MGRRRVPRARPSGPGGLRAAVIEGELDLHGLTSAEAEVRLGSFLEGWRRQRPGAVLRVITGKGKRSEGRPVLQPLVRELLTRELSPWVEEFAADSGGGAYLVRVSAA